MSMTENGALPQTTGFETEGRDHHDVIDPIWTYYFDGRPLEISRAFCGYTLDEWRFGGKSFFKRVFTHDSIERMRFACQQILKTASPLHNIPISAHAKGVTQLQYFLVNYKPVLDSQNTVVGLRGDARNITDLQVVHNAFIQDPALLANLIQSTPDLILIFYFDGRPGFANHGFAGYSMRKWAQEGMQIFNSTLDKESLRRFNRSIQYVEQANESVRNIELKLLSAEKGKRHLLATFSPVVSGDGVIGGQAIVHDITDLTLAKSALRLSETRFRDLIDNAHDLVWIVNRHGQWEYLNKAASKFYGIAPDDLLGRHFTEVVHPDCIEKDLSVFSDILCGREVTDHDSMHLHADGTTRYLSFNVQPRLDDDWEIVGALGMARDVTEQKSYERQLEHLAIHDVMTGLYNRHFFEKELTRTVDITSRTEQCAGLLYIDMDNFKYVNDTLGHAAGDQLLLEVSQMLSSRLRQGDLLARFGGDEFTMLSYNIQPGDLQEIAQSFHHLFKGFTFVQGEQVFDIRVSVGAVLIDSNTLTAGEALAHADLACTLAKTRGRNQAHIYNPHDQVLASMVSDVGWSRRINEALEKNYFVLYYQPVIQLSTKAVTHYEVLLRLQEADTVIAPGVFLLAAERFGLIGAIDRWVVKKAIQVLAQYHSQGKRYRFAINLSAKVFDDEGFLRYLNELIKRYTLDSTTLTFELTETAAISHMASAREFIESLKVLGCQVALDDFGSGFSSYGHLKHLPVDFLKIDGSFVQQLPSNPIDQAIVKSMNEVAHALGKQTIAEFVEDAATMDLLREYGVDFVQGYYTGKPAAIIV